MNDCYSEHFLMTIENAKTYAVNAVHFFKPETNLFGCEIGDGNINYVFKVWDEVTGRSIIIKQADKLLRSSGRPLDLHRNKIEAEILKIESRLAPDYVPKVYHYSEAMCALSMEDISAYKNLRTQMLAGKIYPHLAEGISSFLVDTLLPTTDLVIDRALKKERVKLFTNIELCGITEDLVFTEPYYNYKNRNIITPGNENFVNETLYSDEELKGQVGMLRNAFMNHAQALIHGDLHSGSIFANEKGIKVIDPEFAFYGPMGYDVGNVIGNLFLAWANKIFTEPSNTEFTAWVESAIANTFDMFVRKFDKKFDAIVTFPLYNTHFKQQYLAGILADSLGCAGTEMIRRVVGDSKVLEVTTVKDNTISVPMERMLINMGVKLIKERRGYKSGTQITAAFKEMIK
jgi:5-methylthioribose kinase